MFPTQRLPTDPDAVRREVAHELHGRLALASAAVWTVCTLGIFLIYAAGNPRPILPALLAMTIPLVPAVLPWLFKAWLVRRLTARRLAQARGLVAS